MSLGEFVVGAALLLAVFGAASAAAVLVVRRRLSHLDTLERLLAGATVATGVLIVVHLVPMMLGVLSRGSVLVAAALAVGLAALVRPAGASAPDERVVVAPSGRLQWACAAVGAAFAAAAALANLGRWAGDEILGIDSLTFHLPNAGRWIQTGSVWQLDQFLPQLAHANYPNNGDVVLLATILPWHNDFLVRAPIFLFVVLTAVAVGAVARELRAPAAACVLAGAAAIAMPAVALTSILTAMPDALLWWTFATGALFALRHARTGRTSDLVLAGVALGIGCGTKWYGFSSVIAALAIWGLARLWSARGTPGGVRAAVRDGTLLGGLALLGIAPWLVRNLALSENPFFPVKIAPFGATIFDAPRDRALERAGPSIADYIGDLEAMRQLAFEFWQGLGPVAWVCAFALLGWLVLAVAEARARAPRGARDPRVLVLGIVALGLAAVYALTPSSALSLGGVPVLADANTRYALPALLLGLPVIAWLVGHLGERAGQALMAVLAAAVVLGAIDANQITGPRELVLGFAALALLLAAAGIVRASWITRRSVALLAAWALLFGLVGLAGAHGIERRVNDARYLGNDRALDVVLRAAPSGKRIGLAGEWSLGQLSPVWPSFGARIGNHVEYVGKLPPNGFLDRYPDERSFDAALRRGRFDLLIVGRGIFPTQQTREQRWALDAGWRTVGLSTRFRALAPPVRPVTAAACVDPVIAVDPATTCPG